ncbi:unnamed protein product [Polarella glacialis]|uniref:Uncharacterized protein n=1 Tax=Polarella glacialis TaxID=89957 RepID=A0A813EDX0_POLGL|nr:unnamed protein product [Polarella glacialis]
MEETVGASPYRDPELLAACSDLDEEGLEAVLGDLGFAPPGYYVAEFKVLILAAEACARQRRRRFASASETELAWQAHLLAKRRKTRAAEVEERLRRDQPPPGAAAYAKWPSRMRRRLGKAGDNPAQRTEIESKERAKWTVRLIRILKDAKLPAAIEPDGSPSQGRRASTLRSRIKTWEKAGQWFLRTFGGPWPRTVGQVLAYLEARLAEPCARTVPDTIVKTLTFIEVAGEVEAPSRLSTHPAVQNWLEEATTSLAAATRPRKKAQQLLVKIVLAWERTVVDESLPVFVRAFAWYKLTKLWGGMRSSDPQGLPPAKVKLDHRGLLGVFERTKTTGAGKKIEQASLVVSRQAFLEQPEWLATGYGLWKDMGIAAECSDRDYWLPRPSLDLSGCVPRLATYAHASAMSQALARTLKYEGLSGSGLLLTLSGAGLFWTEHSERATINTWARACGVLEDVRKMMCRWQPTCEEGYLRNLRHLVESAQLQIASTIRIAMAAGEDLLDEGQVLDELEDYFKMKWEHSPAEVKDQLTRLKYFWPEGGQDQIAADLVGEAVADSFSGMAAMEEVTQAAYLGQANASVEPEAEEESLPEESDEETAKEEAPPVSHLGKFFISITGAARKRRLHLGGECWRVPGRDYGEFERCDAGQPAPAKYHAVCKQCFPSGVVSQASDEESSSDGSSETSDPSSHGEEA